MALREDLTADINGVLPQTWDLREGTAVPSTDSVALAGGGVNLKATMLSADLADSTALAMWNKQTTARIYKAFLAASSRIIRSRNGEIRSFDGDRVMGVLLGDYKNTNAAKCALQINWMFANVLRPKFQAKYEKLRDGTYKLAHCTGIDTSDVLVVRAGIRNNNDLVWIGRAPNIAAKLSGLRESNYSTYISGVVYDSLNAEAKTYDGRSMWEERNWTNGPVQRIFRSSWTWTPPSDN